MAALELVRRRRRPALLLRCALGPALCEEGGLWGGWQRGWVAVHRAKALVRLQPAHRPAHGVKLAVHEGGKGVEALLVGGVVARVAAGDEAGVQMLGRVGGRETLHCGVTARRQRHHLFLQAVHRAVRAGVCAVELLVGLLAPHADFQRGPLLLAALGAHDGISPLHRLFQAPFQLGDVLARALQLRAQLVGGQQGRGAGEPLPRLAQALAAENVAPRLKLLVRFALHRRHLPHNAAVRAKRGEPLDDASNPRVGHRGQPIKGLAPQRALVAQLPQRAAHGGAVHRRGQGRRVKE